MTIHFVGAGPGAADLITLRAAAMLATADVVLYPGTYLDHEVLGHCRPEARLVDTQDLDLDRILSTLVEAHAAGVPWDMTPGVAAYAAAAAIVGRELTVPLVTQSVVLTRAQARSTAMPESEALANFAATRATLALHLAITRTREVMAELVEHYGADCPVIVVHRATQPGEQVLCGSVADIADQVEAAGLRQAAVILVGPALDPSAGGESYLYDPARDRTSQRP